MTSNLRWNVEAGHADAIIVNAVVDVVAVRSIYVEASVYSGRENDIRNGPTAFWNVCSPLSLVRRLGGILTMGELLDALNAVDERAAPHDRSSKWAIDQAAEAVEKAIEACREAGMPLYTLSRWTRQAPLQALAIAFLVGVLITRRR